MKVAVPTTLLAAKKYARNRSVRTFMQESMLQRPLQTPHAQLGP